MRNLCAVVLSAGHGKRLRPITNSLPKPLLPVLGVPLMRIILQRLLDEGAEEIHCNAFHLRERISSYVNSLKLPVMVHEEDELLGTGGGIANMKAHISKCYDILLHNGDILSNARFENALSIHRKTNAYVTMLLMEEGPPKNVLCGENGEVIEILKSESSIEPSQDQRVLGYSGISILSKDALEFFPDGAKNNLVDIINRIALERPGMVRAYDLKESSSTLHWVDIGTPSGYLEIHRKIILEKIDFHPLIEPPVLPIHICEGASVDPGARWKGFLEIQQGARVESDTYLEDCIVMADVEVKRGTTAKESIITRQGTIEVRKGRERGNERPSRNG